ATPGWSDASDRHVQLLRNRFIWEIVVAHQHAEEPPTMGRQSIGCHSDCSCLLVPQECRIKRIGLLVGHEVDHFAWRDQGAAGGDPQALAPRGGSEPRAKTFRLLNAVEILYEAQPSRLRH